LSLGGFRPKNTKYKIVQKIGGYEEKVLKFYVLVSRPPKCTSLRGTTSFGAFYVKIDVRVFAVTEKWKKNSRHKGVRKVAHAQKRNPLSDLDEIWHFGSYP